MNEDIHGREGHDILISIVNFRTAGHCIACLESLVAERRSTRDFKVVVADGASGDASVKILKEWIDTNGHIDWIEVLPLRINGGFGWAHNQVMLRALQSEEPPAFIHLLNPDTVLEPDALSSLRSAFDKDPKIGVAGSQMINSEGGLQPAGFRLAGIRTEFARGANASRFASLLGAKRLLIKPGEDTADIEAVSGASFMVRVDALHQAGLFDTGFFLYFEALEWMKRLRAHGWTIAHEPGSRVHHVGGAATKLSRDREVLARSARPFYWYQSQRRHLYRTLGSGRARLAGLAWFLGHFFVTKPRAALSRDLRRRLIKNEGRDMLRAWRASEEFDRQAFVPFPDDPTDQPPAWHTRQTK